MTPDPAFADRDDVTELLPAFPHSRWWLPFLAWDRLSTSTDRARDRYLLKCAQETAGHPS